MIVPVTPNNRRIYNEIYEINEVFVNANDERRKLLIEEAMKLCDDLEMI